MIDQHDQTLLDERIAEQNRNVVFTRHGQELALVREMRTLGTSTGPLPIGCSAGCMVRDGDLVADLTKSANAAALFRKTGICVFEDILPGSLIAECRLCFQSTATLIDDALAARKLGTDGAYAGHEITFNEVCQRGGERLDIRVVWKDGALADSRLHGDAPWMPFVQEVLGKGAHECFRGVVDNRPGSAPQEWHADGVHANYSGSGGASLTPEEWHIQSCAAVQEGCIEEAAQRMTLFLPLDDLRDLTCGATQFFPGSHTHATANLYRNLASKDCETQPMFCTPRPACGGMIAFDYRLIHRGTPNCRPRGSATRPIFYVVYATAGMDDGQNFPTDKPLEPNVGNSFQQRTL